MNHQPKRTDDFYVESIYGAKTQQPLVKVSFNGKELTMMPAEDAQALALNLLSAAEASLVDAFLVTFLHSRVNAPDREIVQILREFREWREKRET